MPHSYTATYNVNDVTSSVPTDDVNIPHDVNKQPNGVYKKCREEYIDAKRLLRR